MNRKHFIEFLKEGYKVLATKNFGISTWDPIVKSDNNLNQLLARDHEIEYNLPNSIAN